MLPAIPAPEKSLNRTTKQIEGLKFVLEGADSLWKGGAARAAGDELACRSGCFGCCLGLFEISYAETLLVRHDVSRLPEAERREVLARAERIVRETAAEFPGVASTGILDPGRGEEEDDRYFEVLADRACPALELPSGRCRIYEGRPVTCRTYGLAWTRDGESIHPPCGLNLVDAPLPRMVETGVDLERLDAVEARAVTVAAAAGLLEGAESTVAHALTGTAFGPLGP